MENVERAREKIAADDAPKRTLGVSEGRVGPPGTYPRLEKRMEKALV
jgi:hypothetical protein